MPFDVADRLELTDRCHRYSHRLDAGDMDGLLELFSESAEAEFIHQGKSTTYVGRDDLRRLYQPGMDSPDPVRHLMTNLVFLEQSADHARTACYVMVTRKREGRFHLSNTLTYAGLWRKEADVWRIAQWVLTVD